VERPELGSARTCHGLDLRFPHQVRAHENGPPARAPYFLDHRSAALDAPIAAALIRFR
jgi:hypothetical protein